MRKDAEKTDPVLAEPKSNKSHPLASSAGIFKDDPFWDAMMAEITASRQEMDVEYDTPEEVRVSA